MNQTNNQQCLRLYLIRHGEVEGVTPGQLLGQTDKPLSARGIAQAQQLAEQLRPVKLIAIHSSDLQRARLTAEIIAKSVDLKVQHSSDWREVDMGDWEEQTVAALHQRAPGLVAQIFNDPASFEYPGGESFAEFTARVNAALDELIMTHQSGDVALVAHGGVCRAIIGSALEIPMRNWLRIAQHYGCLNIIEWYSGKPVVSLINRVWRSSG
jgi:alpha-ribazole phosphatase